MGEFVDDPRRRGRALVGWTKRARVVFLDTLAANGSVRQAAQAAERTHASAYALRRRDAGFAGLWDAALLAAYARLEEELLSRAIGAVPADTTFDAALALKVLARHEALVQVPRGKAAPARVAKKIASIDEVERSLARKLAALGARPAVAP